MVSEPGRDGNDPANEVSDVEISPARSSAPDSRLLFGITLPLIVWLWSLSAENEVIDIALSSCRSGTTLPCAVVLEAIE